MEDFSFNGIHYKSVEVPIKQGCDGCAFFVNAKPTACDNGYSVVPPCTNKKRAYIFVETSQIPPKQA